MLESTIRRLIKTSNSIKLHSIDRPITLPLPTSHYFTSDREKRQNNEKYVTILQISFLARAKRSRSW